MKTFDLVHDSSVLIYGAGIFGQNIYSKVKGTFDVQCFIDKRVDSIKDINVPVRDLEHISEYKDCAVIICVHDGNWHYEIAEDLHARGFDKIVFLALADVYKKNESFLMKKTYNLFLEEQYDCLTGIPCYSKMKKDAFEENVIRKNEAFVTTYCGRELLYSYDEIDEHQKGKMSEEVKALLNVPVIVHKQYIEMFRFFMFGEGSCDLYIKNMKNLNNSFDMDEEAFLQSQYLIYQLLEKEYEKGSDAFAYAPIDVKWNPRGYFNVIDGHHRCAFYCLKGLQNIPVRMTREDYEIWKNDAVLMNLEKLLLEDKSIPYIRINHPVLGEYKCQHMEYEKTVLDIMQEWLYDEKLLFRSVLELSNHQAYYSRNFYRMKKAEEITAVVSSKEDAEFAHALNQLQYIPEDTIRIFSTLSECAEENKQYELCMLCGLYEMDELKNVLEYLNDNVTNQIFWQSKSDAEAEKNYIINYSEFRNYKHMAKKCLDGRLVEIGVFSK